MPQRWVMLWGQVLSVKSASCTCVQVYMTLYKLIAKERRSPRRGPFPKLNSQRNQITKELSNQLLNVYSNMGSYCGVQELSSGLAMGENDKSHGCPLCYETQRPWPELQTRPALPCCSHGVLTAQECPMFEDMSVPPPFEPTPPIHILQKLILLFEYNRNHLHG